MFTIANSILNYCGISKTISSEKVIYYVQVGAFSNRENAEKLANYLTKNNITSIIKAEKRYGLSLTILNILSSFHHKLNKYHKD